MAFKNPHESHDHSKQILDLLYQYDSFLDSLSVIADFGCGAGLDVEWWATLHTRDDPPEPRNYIVYAVDQKDTLEPGIKELPNVKLIVDDFERDRVLPRKCDFLWVHDSFQYCLNPINTLKIWNQQMAVNGMMVLSIPQNSHYSYNRPVNISQTGSYYNHNLVSLIYMLAVNGFDCRDAYFLKDSNDPWLYAAVYKSDIEPMDPRTTSWHDLASKNLISDFAIESLTKYNHVRQEDIFTVWLDKMIYFTKE